MSLSNEEKEILEYLWDDEHKVEWIEAFIKIADKDSNIVPFILTDQQKEFVRNMERKNIILKSRQLGFSLVICALSLRECIVKPYSSCLMLSYDQTSTNEVFDKLKIMYDNLPDWIKPEEKANNRTQLKLENGSKITCSTVGEKDKGRGGTHSIIHLSEFSLWKNAKRQLTGLTKALVPNGNLIIETTAQGINYFHDLYFSSKNGETDFKSFFYNWIDGRQLFEKDYENAIAIWKARNNNKMLTKADLDDEELELMKLGATLDQLVFRRLEVSSDGLDKFHQERPSTDLEAFLSSGATVFDTKRIDSLSKELIALKKNNKDYIKLNKLKKTLPDSLKALYGSSLFIYKELEPNMRYSIGVDVSEGLSGNRDYSVCTILDRNGVEVAMLRSNKIAPYDLAKLINDLGRYFNNALLCIERASGGHTVIDKLFYDYKYYNMTKYTTYDEKNRSIVKRGFDTNSKTKGIIINDLREWFDNGLIQINSIETLSEMKTFEAKDNGSFGAMNGSHDDCVMSKALAIAGLKEINKGKWYPM